MTHKVLNIIGLIVILGWLAMLGQVAYWANIPINVIDYYGLPCKVLNEDHKVKRGEYLKFELDYQKHIDLPGKLSRTLTNDRIINLTCTEGGILKRNGRRKAIIEVFIPPNIFPGKYKLVTNITYHVNPLRDEQDGYETEEFEVLE